MSADDGHLSDMPSAVAGAPVAGPSRAWLWLAALTIGLGLAAVLQLHPWKLDLLDARRVLVAGATWAEGGDPYAIPGYFYTPALTVLASLLPGCSIAVLVLAEIAVAVALAPRHLLAVVAVLVWPPVWGDIALGNVTIVLVGALVLAVRGDSVRRGLLFGLGLALVPKPMFVPVLIWMAVHRRRSLAGVVLAGLLITAPAAVLTGSYPSFVAALTRGIDPAFSGNLGITTVLPAAGLAMSLIAVIVAIAFARSERDGLIAASIAGTFMGTYIGIYAPLLPAAALRDYVAPRPRRALLLAWVGAVSFLALPIVGLAALGIVAFPGGGSSHRVPSAADATSGPPVPEAGP